MSSARAARGGYTAAARRAGRARAAAFEGLDLELRQIDALIDACEGGLRDLIKKSILTIQADARARLRSGSHPYATGRTYEAIRTITFDDGNTGKVYVDETYDEEGRKRPKNLPLWIEYGTIHQNARPFLIPAFERERVLWQARALALLQKAA